MFPLSSFLCSKKKVALNNPEVLRKKDPATASYLTHTTYFYDPFQYYTLIAVV